jgi:16S rRNA (uracil1498-N3)-methyltransferase
MQKCFHSGDLSVEILEVSNGEKHHLCNVMRTSIGEEVMVLNGQGIVAFGRLIASDKNCARIKIETVSKVEKTRPHITLLQAVLTNNNNDRIIRDATAIGVSEIVFFETQNTECRLKDRINDKLDRWTTIAIEACKQSGNSFLPEISYLQKLEKIDMESFDVRIFCGLSASSQPLHEMISKIQNASKVCVAIGPEGDFSANEYDFLRTKSFVECRLSCNVLRAETAAVYALSIIEQFCKN